jgi:hypothetical protein
MADVEIIFPDKVVGIKPFQLVNLAITVITALLGGAMVMWKVRFCTKHSQIMSSMYHTSQLCSLYNQQLAGHVEIR